MRQLSEKNAKARERRQRRAQQNPEEYQKQAKAKAIKNKFGLSWEQYEAIIQDHQGLCAICGQPETRTINGKLMPLCIDHDEKSGRVRGLLCSNHNVGIGLFNHDIEELEKAINYLKSR